MTRDASTAGADRAEDESLAATVLLPGQLPPRTDDVAAIERVLRESELRHRHVLENIDEIVYSATLTDDDPLRWPIRFVSNRIERVIGHTPAEFLADMLLWTSLLHPEDMAGVEEQTRMIIRSRRNGVRVFRLRHKDTGEFRWLEDRVTPQFDEAGRLTGILGVARDITERKRMEQELIAARAKLEHLSHRLMEAHETERRHIARELHDGIGQNLTAIQLNLQAEQRSQVQASSRLAESLEIVGRVLDEVRNLSFELRPSILDDLGLVAALNWYCQQQAQRTGLQVECQSTPGLPRLAGAIETTCFRIAQEALTNVARHARASRAAVKLSREDDFLHLAIEDDGLGFDVRAVRECGDPRGSLGITSMEERALLAGGYIEFRSAPREGAKIHAWFPLTPPPESHGPCGTAGLV